MAEVRDFARKPENLYRPGPDALVPGDSPNHVIVTGEFKIVFSLSYSEERQETFRHLSISIDRVGQMPHPAIVTEVMGYFGFIGGLESGLSSISLDDGVVVVLQSLNVVETKPIHA